MLAFGLKLLGIGKWIGGIFKQYWKFIVPVLLLAAAYWYHDRAVDRAYQDGIVAEQVANQERVDAVNAKNREFENMMRGILGEFNQDLINQTAERTAREIELSSGVEQIMVDNPIYQQCLVDPEVLDFRNQIRALGPQVEIVDEQ
tara:strand:- start:31 stop:465 length:435 start_codon:yes stop_codon:yes gene_type:complete